MLPELGSTGLNVINERSRRSSSSSKKHTFGMRSEPVGKSRGSGTSGQCAADQWQFVPENALQVR